MAGGERHSPSREPQSRLLDAEIPAREQSLRKAKDKRKADTEKTALQRLRL